MKNNFPIIETERFILRQFTNHDLENVYKGLSNPDVIKYYGISFDTLEATMEQMTWFSNLEKNETGIWWAICSKNENEFYGASGFNGIDKKHKKAEVGFWLYPKNWGKGIMTEIMPRICEYAFEKIGLHRIEGYVESENEKCKNGLAKLDFIYEGTMKDCELKDGNFISVDIYAMINNVSK